MTTARQQHETEHRLIHDDFAALAEAAVSGRFDRDALAEVVQRTRTHIWVEEEVIFPALRDAGAEGQVTVMLREHGEIWSHLDEMDQILNVDRPDPKLAVTVWTALRHVLDQHNIREEGILNAQAGSLQRVGASAQVQALMATEMPADWKPGLPAH